MATSTVELIVDASKATNPLKRVASETKKLEAATQKNSAAFTKSGREIKTAANGMKFFTDATGRARKVNGQFVTTAEAAAAGLNRQGKAANKASKSVNKLGKAVRGLAAGFGIFQAGKFVIFKTAELERQTKSLEVLTGSLGNARSIIKELQQFGAVTPFTSAELIETAKRLKAFGFETEQIVDVTKRLADVAGATGADLGGIATAFGQIQAKGRLQGEELLQLQERGIGLQDELVKMYGFTADEFRKALEGGRISADAVNVALQNITNEGGKYANGAIAQSETLSGKFSTLVDNITVLAQHIGDALAPALKNILGLTNQILAGFNDILSSQVARGVASTKLAMLTPGGTMGDIAQMRANVAAMPTTTLRDDASIQETARRLTDISTFVRELGSAIETRRPGGTSQEERQALEGLQGLIQSSLGELGRRQLQIRAEDKPQVIEPPKLLTRTNTGLTPTGLTPEEKAIQQITQLTNTQSLAQASLVDKRREENKHLALTLSHGKEFADVTKEVTDLVQSGSLSFNKAFDLEMTNQELNKGVDAVERQVKAAEELKQKQKEIAQTIQNSVVGAIESAIDGSKSLAESFGGLLKQLAMMIIKQKVIGNFASLGGGGLLGLIPGLANGGPARAGRPHIVGERGPELFVPNSSGTVVPNHAMGGNANVTVNVDASGSSVEGDGDQAAQLGKAIGIAVQQELIKQKRPGGLLTR